MRIALDISPLESGHKFRGTGAYTQSLKDALLKYFPEHEYIFITKQLRGYNNADLVHFPYFDPFFLTTPVKLRVPTVVTVHDLIPLLFPDKFPPGLKGKIKWLIQKNILKTAAALITDSESSKKDIVKFTGISSNMVTVVYLAAAEEFKEIKNSKSRIDEIRVKYQLPEKYILYVGDVTWNKNLPNLIHAVKKLNFPLVMVGKALKSEIFDKDNSWNDDLTLISQEITKDPNIIRTGYVPLDDLVKLYNLASVLVMPSMYEGFGLPILEAMSCGCPVVTSAKGSIKEVAGDSVRYVDPEDVYSIAAGIKAVYLDKSIQESLRLKGLTQARKFSWKKTAANTLDVYAKILSGK